PRCVYSSVQLAPQRRVLLANVEWPVIPEVGLLAGLHDKIVTGGTGTLGDQAHRWRPVSRGPCSGGGLWDVREWLKERASCHGAARARQGRVEQGHRDGSGASGLDW